MPTLCISRELLKFNKGKCNVLHLCQGNPKNGYKQGDEWIERSPEEKDLGTLINESSTCTLAAQKANCILDLIEGNTASR